MSSQGKRNLLLIGPAPLSVGGVAVHMRRLAFLLKDNFNFSYVDEGRERYNGIFNLRSLNLFRYLKLVRSAEIVYINSGLFFLRIFHILICKILLGKKTIVTIHHDVTKERMVSLTKLFVKRCDILLVVNQTTKKIFDGIAKKMIYLSAFIPPDLNDEPELPQLVVDWCNMRRKSKDSVIMISNAWNLVTHNGCDLYGLDLCLEAMRYLHAKGMSNFYLIFIIASNTSNKGMLDGYKRFISDNNLGENIMIWESSLSFIRLIQKCDIVLRATNTDGEALTIREALCFGKKVVASDVIPRPESCFLFKNRDSISLVNSIIDAASHKQQKANANTNTSYSLEYYRDFYMEIFK